MNKSTISHINMKNQQQSSWNDDPFGIEGIFTRKVFVNHERNLEEFSLNLVAEYGKYRQDQYELDLDMVPIDEQNELVRLYIETIDREIEWACYGDDQTLNSNFLCALLAMLKDDSKETREKFAETTRTNILIYYKATLERILSNACEDYTNYKEGFNGWYDQNDYEGELS